MLSRRPLRPVSSAVLRRAIRFSRAYLRSRDPALAWWPHLNGATSSLPVSPATPGRRTASRTTVGARLRDKCARWRSRGDQRMLNCCAPASNSCRTTSETISARIFTGTPSFRPEGSSLIGPVDPPFRERVRCLAPVRLPASDRVMCQARWPAKGRAAPSWALIIQP